MIWLLRRKHKEDDSRVALDEARKSLEKIQERSREVNEVKQVSEHLLKKNHFMEQLGQIMWGSQ